ncbi:hypothetical protein N183_34280 [Sinorhizobium sp. Sb3]|uniref:hypothetical protein n=1 Tax=Sinorhizobium/Ensifer group TaxID=227292 RepID=UPI0007246BDA|nr:hypothetical protein [Sinorhizobium sp. Sb3]KSV64934.1 hypothetical protein N183_34280 [Sinorhizobium sp. Sb3]
MARLLDGRPERTDDALTISNLAYEAAVSRATANRAVGLLAEFRTAESCRRRSLLKALKERPSARSSRASSHARHRDAELPGLVYTPAPYSQVLTLQDAGRNAVIERVCGTGPFR